MLNPGEFATRPIAATIEAAASYISGKLPGGAPKDAHEKEDPIEALQTLEIDQELQATLAPLFARLGFNIAPDVVVSRSGVSRKLVIARNSGPSVYIISVHKCVLESFTDRTFPAFTMLTYLFSENSRIHIISRDLDAMDVGFETTLEEWVQSKGVKVAFIPWKWIARLLRERDEENRFRTFQQIFKFDVSSSKTGIGATRDQTEKSTPVTHSRPDRIRRTIRIFLASSSELREDRDAFDLYFRSQNDQFIKRAIYLEIVRWEHFLDAVSETRLQDEYNKAVRECDIFVCLFFTKAGKFTEEEFDIALGAFKEKGKPRIFTFFKRALVDIDSLPQEDFNSLREFQKKLGELGHFYTRYDNIDDMKLQFRDQLDKVIEQTQG